MVNVSEFFRENVKNNEYYKYYFEYISLSEEMNYVYFDDNKVIEEFKALLNPKNEKVLSPKMDEKFIILSFYLHQNGYYIKQFPTILDRPKEDGSLYKFMNVEFRKYILKARGESSGIVSWDERRKLISELEFIKKEYVVSSELDSLFIRISTRSASFMDMSSDEKLKELCNVIEYILKEDGKFIDLNYNECFDILNKDKIKEYKNKLNCFRHSSKDSLIERNSYNDFQKDILIRYGIFVVETIYNLQTKN